MRESALTLTVVANMTSNYSEGLGNIASVQKVFKNRQVYAIRSRESLKNAIMVQSGLYDDLQTEVNGATQKKVEKELNAAICGALEGGYMNTKATTYIRRSSFYLTDAIAAEGFVNETRFHNNLFLASTEATQRNINLQEKAGEAGLMPYQYEYDKSLKVYSLTIDLDMIGKDENFKAEAPKEVKIDRVCRILGAVENLSLVVKGNLDNAEPLFAIGGLSPRKTHVFENLVTVKADRLNLSRDLIDKAGGYHCGLLQSGQLLNEKDILDALNPETMTKFFENLRQQVTGWYEQ